MLYGGVPSVVASATRRASPVRPVAERSGGLIGTVYVLQGVDTPDGPVKIGYTSRRVHLRLSELQTGSPEKLTVLTDVSGTYADEVALHKVFEAYLVLGEWYVFSPPIQELVQYLVDGGSLRSWLDSQPGKEPSPMGVSELRIREFKCDGPTCGATQVAAQNPPGWTFHTREVGPCGLTDYYRTEHACFCPVCTAQGEPDRWKARG